MKSARPETLWRDLGLLALVRQRIIVSDEGLDGMIGLGHLTFEGFGSSHNRVVITEFQ